jgi:putative glutamine amidotransferase
MRQDQTAEPLLIAVTVCSAPADYLHSLEQLGAHTRLVGADLQTPGTALQGAHGLVLTGGADIDPARYGEARHSTVTDAEPGRDAYEEDLVHRALAVDLPVLAICRGAQVLNVALGGSLVQDIPTEVPAAGAGHDPGIPKAAEAHDVALTPGSALSRAMGAVAAIPATCRVNSRHHQSVKRLGAGLVVSALSPDGIVEGIERPDSTFCIGVQWHPENFWHSGQFRPLFEAFLRACDTHRRSSVA